RFLALLFVLLAAGCVSQDRVAREAAIPAYPGDPYRAALQTEFRELADRAAARSDFNDAKFLLDRAEYAARAVTVRPLEIDAFGAPPAEQAALAAARDRLVRLFDGGRARAPADLARAHAAFECWLMESIGGRQMSDVHWCRDRFEAAETATRFDAGLDADWGVVVPGADGHVGAITVSGASGDGRLLDQANAASFANPDSAARPARLTTTEMQKVADAALDLLPPPPAVYTIFFASGRADINAEARETLAAAAADAATRPAVDVEILGFADRAGDDPTNLEISHRRAAATRQALLDLGVPAEAFLIYARGEAAPAIPTADGVAELRNRRVEITVR
ncbi:MAG: OmpA family protein, partial [Alphaproteobacteria bacterium]